MDKCIDCHAADLCGEDVHVDHVLVDHAGAGPPRGHQVARHVAVRGVALRRRQGLRIHSQFILYFRHTCTGDSDGNIDCRFGGVAPVATTPNTNDK